MTATGLIPRKRLERIPRALRLAHDYCFFLHDQCVHLLVQYEAAEAHLIKVKFRSKVEAATFAEVAKTDSVEPSRICLDCRYRTGGFETRVYGSGFCQEATPIRSE